MGPYVFIIPAGVVFCAAGQDGQAGLPPCSRGRPVTVGLAGHRVTACRVQPAGDTLEIRGGSGKQEGATRGGSVMSFEPVAALAEATHTHCFLTLTSAGPSSVEAVTGQEWSWLENLLVWTQMLT